MEIPPRRAIKVSVRVLLTAGPLALLFSGICLVFLPALWALVFGWCAVILLFVCFYAVFIFVGEFVYLNLPPEIKYGPGNSFWATVLNPKAIAIVIAVPVLFAADQLMKRLV